MVDPKESRKEAVHGHSWLKVSSMMSQNKRTAMEDTNTVFLTEDPSKPNVVAVYDGHGGNQVSRLISRMLFKYIAGFGTPVSLVPVRWISLILDEAIHQTAVDHPCSKLDASGSTACFATLEKHVYEDGVVGARVIVFNVGDSFCVVKESEAQDWRFITVDHQPVNNQGEISRVQMSGHKVMGDRVDGTLAPSRCFGDFSFKKKTFLPPHLQAVTTDPEIFELYLRPGAKLFFASDGLIEDTEREDFISMLKASEEDTANGLELLEDVMGKMRENSADNMTANVVELVNGKDSHEPGFRFVPGLWDALKADRSKPGGANQKYKNAYLENLTKEGGLTPEYAAHIQRSLIRFYEKNWDSVTEELAARSALMEQLHPVLTPPRKIHDGGEYYQSLYVSYGPRAFCESSDPEAVDEPHPDLSFEQDPEEEETEVAAPEVEQLKPQEEGGEYGEAYSIMSDILKKLRGDSSSNPEAARGKDDDKSGDDCDEKDDIDYMGMVSVPESFAFHPLHESAYTGDLNPFLTLQPHDEALNTRDALGNTPLHYAAMTEHYDIADQILNLDEDSINRVNVYGWPPAREALGRGDTKMLKRLLKPRRGRENVTCVAYDGDGAKLGPRDGESEEETSDRVLCQSTVFAAAHKVDCARELLNAGYLCAHALVALLKRMGSDEHVCHVNWLKVKRQEWVDGLEGGRNEWSRGLTDIAFQLNRTIFDPHQDDTSLADDPYATPGVTPSPSASQGLNAMGDSPDKSSTESAETGGEASESEQAEDASDKDMADTVEFSTPCTGEFRDCNAARLVPNLLEAYAKHGVTLAESERKCSVSFASLAIDSRHIQILEQVLAAGATTPDGLVFQMCQKYIQKEWNHTKEAFITALKLLMEHGGTIDDPTMSGATAVSLVKEKIMDPEEEAQLLAALRR